MTKITFASKPQEKTFKSCDQVNLLNLDVIPSYKLWPQWAMGLAGVWTLAVFVIWVISLVRMGKCGGRSSWLWWATIFIPLLVPIVGQSLAMGAQDEGAYIIGEVLALGVGPLWAFIVGIIVLVKLPKGKSGKLLNMSC